jgi:hypothetical protein
MTAGVGADGQTLLLWYLGVEPRDGAYVRLATRGTKRQRFIMEKRRLAIDT